MANNRMWLKNTRTGARVHLAKYYPSTGWYTTNTTEALDQAFDDADFGHLSPEEREAKHAQVGFGAPHSMGGMYGAEWVLEYETGPDQVPPQSEVSAKG